MRNSNVELYPTMVRKRGILQSLIVSLIDPFKGTLKKAQGFLVRFLHYCKERLAGSFCGRFRLVPGPEPRDGGFLRGPGCKSVFLGSSSSSSSRGSSSSSSSS